MPRRKKTDEPTPSKALAQALFEQLMAQHDGDAAAVLRAMNGPGGYLEQILDAAEQTPDASSGPAGAPLARGSAGRGFDPLAPENTYVLPEPPAQVNTYRVRIDIDDAKPPIWRRIDVAGDLTLEQLHIVIQAVFGWEDYHLHSFTPQFTGAQDKRLRPFPNDGTVEFCDEAQPDEELIRLDQVVQKPGDRLFYEYDFGDGWEHTLSVEKVLPRTEVAPRAALLGGRRAGPPEDAGGIWRYNEITAALAGEETDLGAEELDELREWLPEDFDPAVASLDVDLDALLELSEAARAIAVALVDNPRLAPDCADLVRRAADAAAIGYFAPLFAAADLPLTAEPPSAALAAVLAGLTTSEAEAVMIPWRTFLTEIGPDGAQLTAAGYLKPVMVKTLFTSMAMDEKWMGTGNREDQTLPVLNLREGATAVGLVRKNKGRLLPTKAAGTSDPIRLWRHVAGRLTSSREAFGRHCAVLALLTIAGHGRLTDPSGAGPALTVHDAFRSTSATLLQMIGWSSYTRPLNGWDAWHASSTVWVAFDHPACITPDGQVTPAGRRLARAALLTP